MWKLDRLGRSLKHLIESVQELDSRKTGFKSLQDNIDTTTPGGKVIFHILDSLTEFEQDLIRERTNAGLAATRARGREGKTQRGPNHEARSGPGATAEPKAYGPGYRGMLHISQTTFYRYVQVSGDA